MKREYHAWYSERCGRQMEALVFGHAGEPVILFPTSFGRFYENEERGLLGALTEKIEAGRYTVMCVDNYDMESWANKAAHPAERIARHEAYEAYIVQEAAPFVRAQSSGGRLTLTGASYGGFLAALIGLRHPDVVQRIVTFSAVYEPGRWLGEYEDDRVHRHSPLKWIPSLEDRERLEALYRQEIILAVPEHDHGTVIDSNRTLSGTLWAKGIGNHLSIWNGARHDWPYWRPMIDHYLPW